MKATYKHPQIKKITTETESLMGPGASSAIPPTVGAPQGGLINDDPLTNQAPQTLNHKSVWDE